jgi:hypothetical protein
VFHENVERQYEDFLFSLLKPEEQYASSESFKPITEKAGVVYLKESLIELARFQEPKRFLTTNWNNLNGLNVVQEKKKSSI